MLSANFCSLSREYDFDVSVIIPTYNRISMLEEALKSVLSQDFSGSVEIIVVDDNSDDGTSSVVTEKYTNVHLIELKRNVGPSLARNQAILQSRGKYIAFLDSDDLWEPDYLKAQISALEDMERGIAISDVLIWNITRNSKKIRTQRPDLERYISPAHHLLVSNFIVTLSSVVIPRIAFKEVGLFDEKLRVGEDADLYLRCILGEYRLVFTGVSRIIKREHNSEQLTDDIDFLSLCRLKRIEKFYASSVVPSSKIVPPYRRACAESYVAVARMCVLDKDFLGWRNYLWKAFLNAPLYGLSCVTTDIKNFVITYLLRIKRSIQARGCLKK